MTTERDKWFDDMAAMLQFLADRPDLPLPEVELTWWHWGDDDMKTAKMVARNLGTFDKQFTDYSLCLSKKIGEHVTLRYYFTRGTVCERVQVGTKKETRREAETYVEREVEVPIYEYKCPPLLGPDEVEESST